ncbi:Rieske 2Fe-2S domain-containing protein [Rhodococcus artemisiae]|uniref:Rieske 2Fe-2S domain-containing protein n=1 Tax=Rhodococcus artemisiae TaxID=714159 RepID=A0ABU7LHN8_9NOCA|nr:Rieske 2Fe-2S domain-containing protein [Rhodococcus artemisiae]MEE2061081.1 Rieske 2Fe-2S domain-containing protein [Rhodococcus artemisiae]
MTPWVSVALTRDIEPGSATGTAVNGAPVALWRGADGVLHAWADRCPHRGMRLSLGFVRGARLVCLYHGWQFDGKGACRHVPAHPKMTPPSTVTPVRYRAVDRSGIAWVSTTDSSDTAVPERSAPETAPEPIRSVWFTADTERVIDRLRSEVEDLALDGHVATGQIDGVEIRAGIQKVDEATTAVHVVAVGNLPAETVTRLVRRLHDIRDSVTTTVEAVQ